MFDSETYELESLPDYFTFSDTTASPRSLPENESLIPGSTDYKKARKRRQNRESAARARSRKKMEMLDMQKSLQEMTELHSQLTLENAALKAENTTLKKELEFYRGIIKSTPHSGRAKKQSEWLMASMTFTIVCVILMFEQDSFDNYPLTTDRTLKHIKQVSSPFSFGIGSFVSILCALCCAYKYARSYE